MPLQALPGIVAAVGPARQADLTTFTSVALELIRLRAGVNPIADVQKWRDAGARGVVLQLLSPAPGRGPLSPNAFVDAFAEVLEAFLVVGVRDVEVHDEPNRADRGAGVSWQDGTAFADWFGEVAYLLRRRVGGALRIGFPALSLTELPHPDPVARIDASAFLKQCCSALESADWAALHLYWRTLAEMRGLDGALGSLHSYLRAFPRQRFIVTEFANVNLEMPVALRGEQYTEFMLLMAQYERVLGACGFLLRSYDRRYRPLGWLDADGRPTAVVDEIAARSRLPDPHALGFFWPTERRRYDQLFGQDPQHYYDCCRMTGGHNGVDLGVDVASPEASPIRAALPGTVTQVAFDEVGYGHHIRVRSYGPMGEEITLLYAHLSRIEVTVGMLVSGGELLGWAGSSPYGRQPHLHLGMRMKGVSIPPVFDGLNPRPYLQVGLRRSPQPPPARGSAKAP